MIVGTWTPEPEAWDIKNVDKFAWIPTKCGDGTVHWLEVLTFTYQFQPTGLGSRWICIYVLPKQP
jgi:hypothetical protein